MFESILTIAVILVIARVIADLKGRDETRRLDGWGHLYGLKRGFLESNKSFKARIWERLNNGPN